MKSINQIRESFIDAWVMLSRGAKRVFQKLQWYYHNKRYTFLSLATLAKMCLLSVRQVQRILDIFRSKGWIASIKRSYQSNVTFLADEIAKINLRDIRNFKKTPILEENVHPNVHVLGSYKDSYANKCTEQPVHSHKAKMKRPIPDKLKKIQPLSDWERQTLSNLYSEYAINAALEDAHIYHFTWKNKINKLFNFLSSQASKATKKLRGYYNA